MLRRVLALMFVLALIPTAALAGNPEQRLERLLRKGAVLESEVGTPQARPRVACVCQPGFNVSPGFLMLQDNGDLVCAVVTDFQDGLIRLLGTCTDFEALSR